MKEVVLCCISVTEKTHKMFCHASSSFPCSHKHAHNTYHSQQRQKVCLTAPNPWRELGDTCTHIRRTGSRSSSSGLAARHWHCLFRGECEQVCWASISHFLLLTHIVHNHQQRDTWRTGVNAHKTFSTLPWCPLSDSLPSPFPRLSSKGWGVGRVIEGDNPPWSRSSKRLWTNKGPSI